MHPLDGTLCFLGELCIPTIANHSCTQGHRDLCPLPSSGPRGRVPSQDPGLPRQEEYRDFEIALGFLVRICL